MTRAYAHGPRGERVVCKTPHGHWKVLSTIAAMTVHGMLGYGTFDGATDTDTFIAFVRDGLVPHLVPGQVVVLNPIEMAISKVRSILRAAGARTVAHCSTRSGKPSPA
jgi:hypothetical protein